MEITHRRYYWYCLLSSMLLLHSCASEPDYLFEMLPTEHTGIDFVNTITETEDLNILNFHYIYNGGGVGVGDFNNDGLQDLVFSGNQVQSKIYQNTGDLTFKEITSTSGFDSEGWSTGVSIVDINDDGWQDIYISTGGYECDGNCRNQLFINKGTSDISFEESAESYGLSDGLYTQQTVFFDFDGDDDLDAYLLHNAIDKRDKNAPTIKSTISEKSADQLLENRNGTYVDVSEEMGITERGYGLGIALADLNNDGRIDIYVANDFLSDDLLYINKGIEDGEHLGFEESAKKYLKHTSYNSMGVDISDINNDGTEDILVVDMLPEHNQRQKTMLGFMNYNKFKHGLKNGYSAQFVRNTLQIGNGVLNDETVPYSEVGQIAGISNTDWSWCPLMADFDNDGDKDIFITNGYGRDITDLDFINYSMQRTNAFGTPESREKDLYQTVKEMKQVKMKNYIFENEGDLIFTKRNDEWMESPESISNGAVYTDLDNDGDLDLVVNNIDQPAFVMENTTVKKDVVNHQNHWVKIKFDDPTKAIGAVIKPVVENRNISLLYSPVRGYLSTTDMNVHIGLGDYRVGGLEVFWPNGGKTVLTSLVRDTTYVLSQPLKGMYESGIDYSPRLKANQKGMTHVESKYRDFNQQPLLLAQHSRQGPCMAIGKVKSGEPDMLFVGGAKGIAGQIILGTGTNERTIELPNKNQEDTDAVFFDIDGDDDQDLYVVAGGVEGFRDGEYQDRVYINEEGGRFVESPFLSPADNSSGTVAAGDFDNDGDVDLFVGGRVEPGKYPVNPESYLLKNESGKLQKCNAEHDIEFDDLGMVTDAEWTDYDQDGDLDLIIVGEWMPIRVLENIDGRITKLTSIPKSSGLWNTIKISDIDGDGDDDYLLGNHGLNSRLQATVEKPLVMYKKDFDQNGSIDPLIGQFITDDQGAEKLYPYHSRDDVVGQIVKVKNRYKRYDEFGQATFLEILGKDAVDDDFLEATTLSSAMLINNGGTDWDLKDLPREVQVSPVQDILPFDIDSDGDEDLLIVGNDFTREKTNGWISASNGLVLMNRGNYDFSSVPAHMSGFLVPGDGRQIVKRNLGGQDMEIIAGQNSGPFLYFKTR